MVGSVPVVTPDSGTGLGTGLGLGTGPSSAPRAQKIRTQELEPNATTPCHHHSVVAQPFGIVVQQGIGMEWAGAICADGRPRVGMRCMAVRPSILPHQYRTRPEAGGRKAWQGGHIGVRSAGDEWDGWVGWDEWAGPGRIFQDERGDFWNLLNKRDRLCPESALEALAR